GRSGVWRRCLSAADRHTECAGYLGNDTADAELIAHGSWLAAAPVNLDHLFAEHRTPLLIGQGGHDLFARRVDDFPRRWPGQLAVEAEGDPAGLFADRDAFLLFRRLDGVIEDMKFLVKRIDDPDLFFVRSQSDAMARAAVA